MSGVILFVTVSIIFLTGWNAANLYQEYMVTKHANVMKELNNLKQLCNVECTR